jgi:hypothetical protein
VSEGLHRLHYPTRTIGYTADLTPHELVMPKARHYRDAAAGRCSASAGPKMRIVVAFHEDDLAGLIFPEVRRPGRQTWEELHINTAASSIDQERLVDLAFGAACDPSVFGILGDWLDDCGLTLPAARARLLEYDAEVRAEVKKSNGVTLA